MELKYDTNGKKISEHRLAHLILQSALVISNSKGLTEIHRDTRSSTYQISRIEKKI